MPRWSSSTSSIELATSSDSSVSKIEFFLIMVFRRNRVLYALSSPGSARTWLFFFFFLPFDVASQDGRDIARKFLEFSVLISNYFHWRNPFRSCNLLLIELKVLDARKSILFENISWHKNIGIFPRILRVYLSICFRIAS